MSLELTILREQIVMSLQEIQKAICELSFEDRKTLFESIIPRKLPQTDEQIHALKKEYDLIGDDEWINWDDLRPELVSAD